MSTTAERGVMAAPLNTIYVSKDWAPQKISSNGFSCTDIFDFDSFDGVDLLGFVKQHDSTLNFPEKLMLMLTHVEREYAKNGRKTQEACISWVPNGLAFVIRDKDALVKYFLPLFFGQSKFTSFTRKLYRWGFKQFSRLQNQGINRGDICFSNAFFQRDNKSIISKMHSVTAARNRRGKHKALIDTTTTAMLVRKGEHYNQQHQEEENSQHQQLSKEQVIKDVVCSADTDDRDKNYERIESRESKSIEHLAVKAENCLGTLGSPLIQEAFTRYCRSHAIYGTVNQKVDSTCHDMMLSTAANFAKPKETDIYEAVDILLHFASTSASRTMTEKA